MKLQLIRNATLRLTYGGHTFVIDPYLAVKHSLPSYTGRSPNPLVDLPMPPEAVLDGIEMAVVSHLHSDHFDKSAQVLLPKDTPIFCQPGNENRIEAQGFEQVTPIVEEMTWHDISLRRTPGRHGFSENVLKDMGQVSGFIFQNPAEPTVYWAGDTVWYEAVEGVLQQWQPDIIITHSSGAVWGSQGEHIVMNAEQTIAVCRAAPQSTVIATHMEALDHGTVSRADLREAARQAGISDEQLLIPADGEVLELPG